MISKYYLKVKITKLLPKWLIRILFILGLVPECGHLDTCMPVSTKRHCTRTNYSYVSPVLPYSTPCWHCPQGKGSLTFKRRLYLK